MRRSLGYFRRIHLAVLLGVAVTTAVVTGALLVGDSVRGSLRALSLGRLGSIEYALVSERFLRADLAVDLSRQKGFAASFKEAVPAIFLRGSATHAATQARASRTQVHGIDSRFVSLFPQEYAGMADALKKKPGQVFPPLVVNQALQRELNAEVGDPILLSFAAQSAIHREFIFGSRSSADIVQQLRLTLVHIIPDRGPGRFGLQPQQSLPLNAFVDLEVLQKALGQPQQANAVLVAARASPAAEGEAAQVLQRALRQALQLGDLGLVLARGTGYFALESTRFLLRANQVEAARALATQMGAPAQPILTYLATTMEAGGRMVPYSTIAGLDPPARSEADRPFGALELKDGSSAPPLADDEILLNEWAARELGAGPGERIDLSYFVVGAREQLSVQRAQLRLKGVVALHGLGADPELTPEYPGVQDADDMSAWEAPFPLELKRIRPQDEAYWDEFGAAPKAFVSQNTAQRLWSSSFGHSTAVRIGPAAGMDVEQTRARFQKGLLDKIRPPEAGLVFQPVRVRGLEAASGATDFSALFIGFSLFLIVSAALLVGLLFRLGVEQRAGEIGVLLASGYPLATVRRRFAAEGAVLAGLGGLIGLGGAVLYAWLLLEGLRTWWLEAVGTPFLSLHISSQSLRLGYCISLAVVLFSIAWTVRQCGKVPVRVLLKGVVILDEKRPGRRVRTMAFAGLGLAAVVLLLALGADAARAAGLFFASGALLLMSGLAFFSLWLRAGQRHHLSRSGFAPGARLGARNSARRPDRSMLCAALVGCACFVIVAVGVQRRVEAGDDALLHKDSGTGGFALVAEADIPLHQDLNAAEGLFELGFSEADAATLGGARIFPFRVLPGEDVSCLNLYQPQKPRILGVPDELIERGGFGFQQVETTRPEERENPWRLLEQEIEPGVIPVLGDYNSVLWILHLGLGDDLVVQDEWGRDVRLRLVGLLQGSLFQSELLISEAHFKRHFPGRSGYGYFLIQTPARGAEHIASILEKSLGGYGFDATSTRAKLAAYQAVENTYLSTFQTLGGLGLLLGTLGLGIVLLRNAVERSGELAVLRACGFRLSSLALMLLAENGFLLLAGMLIGLFSALVAVAPHLARGASIPYLSLALTLLLVFLVGVAASGVAVLWALRLPLLPALKAE